MTHRLGFAVLVVLLASCAAAWGDDFYWTGDCGSNLWYDFCQNGWCNPPTNTIPFNQNNWGRTACGSVPAVPGSTDVVYLPSSQTVDQNGSASILDLVLQPGAALNMQGSSNSYTLTLNGSAITNDGTVTINSNTYYTSILHAANDLTLLGGGAIRLRHGDNGQINGAIVTQAAEHTIHGYGVINAGLVNDGLVNADMSSNWIRLEGATKTNRGTLLGSNNGKLWLRNVVVTQSPEGAIVADGGSVEIGSGTTITGGTLASRNSGTITSTGNSTLADVTLAAGSILNHQGASGGRTLTLAGSALTNEGTLTINSNTYYTAILHAANDLSLLGSGTILLRHGNDGRLQTAADVTLTQAAGHTIHGHGRIDAALVNHGTIAADMAQQSVSLNCAAPGVVNTGTLAVQPSCTLNLSNAGLFTQTAGQTLVGGVLYVSGGPLQLDGGLLAGSGTINGSVTNAAATVTPGNSVGQLQINGDYAQVAGGTLHVELGGVVPGTEYDRLVVSGTATLTGTLRVTTAGVYNPPVGQKFTILTAGTVTGTFDAVVPDKFDLAYYANRVELTVRVPLSCAGDSNCDGGVGWRDIDFFVAAMNDNFAAWHALFPGGTATCPFANNDTNADGTVNWRDIDPLVALMNTTCP